jgi:hypothetical protein
VRAARREDRAMCCATMDLMSRQLRPRTAHHAGELIVLVATLIYAAQSVLSKVVEAHIPSMEVVLTRSVLGARQPSLLSR